MGLFLAISYGACAWFVQLCLLFDIHFIVGKKADYLLFMSIHGEQREDEDVQNIVKQFKKAFGGMMIHMFFAVGIFFLLLLIPNAVASLSYFYLILWCTVLIWADYKIVKTYANRMYELKKSKGWSTPVRKTVTEVDTVVSRMKKTMPVSEIWLTIPLWICIGAFVWWIYSATEYKMLLITLCSNVLVVVVFGYMFHRIAHGKLKVYSEDSEVNYALNRASKRAWSKCIVWEAGLLSGHHFIITLLLHSYLKGVSTGTEQVTGFWIGFIGSTAIVLLLALLLFWGATNRVKQAKKELAAAANLSYAEDEDVYWKNGYYYNPYDTNTFVENRGFGLTTNMATKWGPITKWILIITLVLCIGLGIVMLPLDFGKMTIKVTEKGVELRGCLYYSETLNFDDVEEVYLLSEAPESSRAWGTDTERFSMGSYHFKGYGNGKAMMDHEAEYYILVKQKSGKWFGFSVRDSEKMLDMYEKLKEKEGGANE